MPTLSTHPALVVHIQGLLCQNSHQTGVLQWSNSELFCFVFSRSEREELSVVRQRKGGQSEQLAGQQLLVMCCLRGESKARRI